MVSTQPLRPTLQPGDRRGCSGPELVSPGWRPILAVGVEPLRSQRAPRYGPISPRRRPVNLRANSCQIGRRSLARCGPAKPPRRFGRIGALTDPGRRNGVAAALTPTTWACCPCRPGRRRSAGPSTRPLRARNGQPNRSALHGLPDGERRMGGPRLRGAVTAQRFSTSEPGAHFDNVWPRSSDGNRRGRPRSRAAPPCAPWRFSRWLGAGSTWAAAPPRDPEDRRHLPATWAGRGRRHGHPACAQLQMDVGSMCPLSQAGGPARALKKPGLAR